MVPTKIRHLGTGPHIGAILLLCQYGGCFGILSIDMPPIPYIGTELVLYGILHTT